MPRVRALYRYPVKGFTPESRESLTVLADGRVAGDRVLGLRFADGTPGDAWSRKLEFVALINTPGLARLRLSFDHAAMRLRIGLGDKILADESLDERGRARIAAAVEEFVLGLEENPLGGPIAHLGCYRREFVERRACSNTGSISSASRVAESASRYV